MDQNKVSHYHVIFEPPSGLDVVHEFEKIYIGKTSETWSRTMRPQVANIFLYKTMHPHKKCSTVTSVSISY